jgi:hypothetical protein
VILLFLLGLAANAASQMSPAGPTVTSDKSSTTDLLSGQHFEMKPYIFSSEQYTSNVYLVKDNKKEDWITTLGPGIRLAINNPSFGADLEGKFGYNWYANKTKEDYWGIDGTLGLRYNPTAHLTFKVKDYILRSENTSEQNYQQAQQPGQPGNIVGTNRGNTPYLRNVLEPSVDWQFSRQGSVSILYRNNILRNDDNTIYEDSTENYLRPQFNYWINQRNGIALDYGFTTGRYSGGPGGAHTPDFVSQNPHGRYTYQFDAQMSVFADYIFSYQDNDDPGIDYKVNNPSVGIVYNFTRDLTGTAQVGYFRMNPDRGDEFTGITSNLSITNRGRRTTYTLAFNSGYEQNQFSFDNLGFNKYYGGTAIIQHQLTQYFSVGFTGSARHVEYAFTDRKDWLYTADATADYRLLKWLTLGGRAGYQEDNSSIDANSYDEWHVYVTLSAAFDNLLF